MTDKLMTTRKRIMDKRREKWNKVDYKILLDLHCFTIGTPNIRFDIRYTQRYMNDKSLYQKRPLIQLKRLKNFRERKGLYYLLLLFLLL